MQRVKQAFTLIELLIVVAIIAILAAIAVPNFLEAQTRAKVARVKSDLRVMYNAFQSYYLDNTNVPPDGNDGVTGFSAYTDWNTENPGQSPDLKWRSGGWNKFRVNCYFNPLTTPVSYVASVPKDPFSSIMPFGYDTLDYRGGGRDKMPYCIVFSCGPDRTMMDWYRGNWPDSQARPYDPTNGTKSLGDVWRAMLVTDQKKFYTDYPFDVQ